MFSDDIMRKKYLLLVLFIFLPLNFIQAAENLKVSLDVSKGKVELGEDFQIVVVVKNASTNGISLGEINVPGLENFEVHGSSDSTQVQISNNASLMISENRRSLKATKLGDFQIGPIVLETKDAQGNTVEVKSEMQTVKVIPASVKPLFSSQVEDAVLGNQEKNMGKEGFDFFGLLKNLFMLGLLILFIYLFRKRQNSIVAEEPEDAFVAKIQVEIPNRASEKYWAELKENILRFVEGKYKINTSALTSSEILNQLKKKEQRAFLVVEMALKICDQGRFSNSIDDRDKILEWVEKINQL